MCELYENAEFYSGKRVTVQARIVDRKLSIDDLRAIPCGAWTKVRLKLSESIAPALSKSREYQELIKAAKRGLPVEAVFTGEFRAAYIWRDKQKIEIEKSPSGGKSDIGAILTISELTNVVIRRKLGR